MSFVRRWAGALAKLAGVLGLPGLMIAGISAVSFGFGLFVLLRESDRPRQVSRRSAVAMLETWARSPDYLGLTLLDAVDLWRTAPPDERGAREENLGRALGRLGDDLEALSTRIPLVRVGSLELRTAEGRPLASWKAREGGASAGNEAVEEIALGPRGDRSAVGLSMSYRIAPEFVGGMNDLETAYVRVLLALLGLSGFSLLCLGYLILHTKALGERLSREAAREATLDLADRTCHELGNGVFVLANERRNLSEHLDLVERFIAEEGEARDAAARLAKLAPEARSRWERALKREYEARGIDPDLELRASAEVARQVCRQIGACSDYIGMTVRELDGFLKHSGPPVSIGQVDVGECVDEALALLRPRIEANGATVARDDDGGGPFVASADRRLLIHALVNLVKNAIEAVRPGGPPPDVRARLARRGKAITVEISDNGPGLGDLAKRRAFEPGFSTKGPGRGRGLAIVRDSVQAQGGEISAEDRPEGGALFRIVLCRSDGPGVTATPGR